VTGWKAAAGILFLLGAGCASRGNPQAALDYVGAGQAAAARKDWRGAIDQYGKAIRRNPDLAEAYYHRGYAYVQLRRDREAAAPAREYEERALLDYQMAIAKNPVYADAYFNRALVYGSRAQFKPAAEDLLHAIRYKPNDPVPHLELARLYEEKFEDKLVQAMEHYEKYVELGGLDADARERVRMWKELKKQQAPAAPAKAPTPEEEKAAVELHRKAMALVRENQKAEAIQAVEELLSKYGHTKHVQDQARALDAVLNFLKK
jgi:tetratricopeptide (TPR) repeat protein